MLTTDAQVQIHLQAVAHAVQPGGCYVLEVTCAADDGSAAEPFTPWSRRRGTVEVRAEAEQIIVLDHLYRTRFRLPWGPPVRVYRREQLLETIGQSGVFALEGCYPECGKTAEGGSQFDLHSRTPLPVVGRNVVVLRRGA